MSSEHFRGGGEKAPWELNKDISRRTDTVTAGAHGTDTPRQRQRRSGGAPAPTAPPPHLSPLHPASEHQSSGLQLLPDQSVPGGRRGRGGCAWAWNCFKTALSTNGPAPRLPAPTRVCGGCSSRPRLPLQRRCVAVTWVSVTWVVGEPPPAASTKVPTGSSTQTPPKHTWTFCFVVLFF